MTETELVVLHKYSSKNEIMKTVAGDMKYIEWLEKEKRRILTANPAREIEIRRRGNLCAMFVDDKSENI